MLLGLYPVLDLADHRGQFCGKILADLEADVIKWSLLEATLPGE